MESAERVRPLDAALKQLGRLLAVWWRPCRRINRNYSQRIINFAKEDTPSFILSAARTGVRLDLTVYC